jgi:mono/diheme cytochrome c family protein
MTLAEARRRKQALMNERPEVAALMAPAVAGQAPMSEPDDHHDAAPTAMERSEVHGGGCAGCHVGRRQTSRHGWLLLAIGLALVWRRTRPGAHPSAWKDDLCRRIRG